MPNRDHYAPRSYLVRHVTKYDYELPRSSAYERGRLASRPTPTQTARSQKVTITPEPVVHTSHIDWYGNPSDYFEIRGEYTELEIARETIIDVHWPEPDLDRLNGWTVAEVARACADAADPRECVEFTMASPLVQLDPGVQEYAAEHLHGDRPFGEALVALTHGIYSDFTYKSGATTVRTTLDELLQIRKGVCQDFAQLAIGCLRSVGIPARYVSGYIETTPPAGKPKLQGSDASHAWTSVRTPDGDWVDLDPTNDHFADSRYVVTAWGRDFQDVSPLRGIVYGEKTESTLDVGVDVLLLDDEGNVAVEVIPRESA